jgi:threonine synthase
MFVFSMGEGNTPLVPSTRIGPSMGIEHLFFKLESCNPSGSYKDRFVVGEVRNVIHCGKKLCVATSSGNTGSSLAAYCARAGLSCLIVVNATAPSGKLAQMQAHGAHVLLVDGFVTSPQITEDVFTVLSQATSEGPAALVVSSYRSCPIGMAGVETISRELCEQAPVDIQNVFVPMGSGGLFTAVCRGFASGDSIIPRIHAVQPAGCATVVGPFQRGENSIRPIESMTRISGLSVPFDIDGTLALEHLQKFGGQGFAVTDDEVFEAQRDLFEKEGIYSEPAGAAALAGLQRAIRERTLDGGQSAICLVTGHGFKDPVAVERVAATRPIVVATVADLRARILRAAQC